MAMTIQSLRENLLSQKADFEIIQHDIPIKSKEDALGYFKIEETAPTLIIETDLGFFALIISGERDKMDFDLIKSLLGCKKVGMAKRNDVTEKLNILPGQIPLVGHNLPCIVDNKIFKHQFVYGGSGDLYYTLKINPYDLAKANNVVLRFD